MSKVIVGMSGGVDSSVSAYLLKQAGYEVEGLFMKNWDEDDDKTYCPAAQDLADATAVCHQLGIPLHKINFAKEYWNNVFEHFLAEYRAHRTPNPDVLCNREIKFKVFLDHALALGADWIATGHYAKTEHGKLYKAKDRSKDQTYFLHAVSEDALKKTLFPLGSYLKTEIRAIAAELGLVTQSKKDSTGICFIGERNFRDFLGQYVLAKPGDIATTQGQIIGKHDGLIYYTLGQRQGLGIGGLKNSDDSPWYVVDKDTENNQLIVGQGASHPRLYAMGLRCKDMHWINGAPEFPATLYAKVRYRQTEQACLVSAPDPEGFYTILFCEPQRAVTPGQYVVLYNQNQCLGGAAIETLIR